MKTALSRTETAIVLTVFVICLVCALVIPPARCPDESARMTLTNWIYEHHSLPTGNEPETVIRGWGFSYALRPYLSAIIGAAFMMLFSLFSRAEGLLLLGSRMGSVLSVTVCCVYCLLLGHRLFRKRSSAILMALTVCFLPQVLFLGSFQNNDSLSLAAVSMMLYYLVCGYDDHFSLKTCIKLGIAFSVALLSYYSVYGWILAGVVFCVVAVLQDPGISRKGTFILQRALLIAGISLLLAGWFFIRNAVLHEGDFLGISSELRMRASMRSQGMKLYEMDSPRDTGLSPAGFLISRGLSWFGTTLRSFIGVFGYMDVVLPAAVYILYLAFFLAGIILFVRSCLHSAPDRRARLLFPAMLAACIITLLLSLYASYARNYQPQGRYIISVILLPAYMAARGADSTELPAGTGRKVSLSAVLSAVWLLLCAVSLILLLPGTIR